MNASQLLGLALMAAWPLLAHNLWLAGGPAQRKVPLWANLVFLCVGLSGLARLLGYLDAATFITFWGVGMAIGSGFYRQIKIGLSWVEERIGWPRKTTYARTPSVLLVSNLLGIDLFEAAIKAGGATDLSLDESITLAIAREDMMEELKARGEKVEVDIRPHGRRPRPFVGEQPPYDC